MSYYSFNEIVMDLSIPSQRQLVEKFLLNQGLELDKDVEYTIAIFHGDRIAGTGSYSKKVLKCIAIDSDYQGEGLSARIVSHLVNQQYLRGNLHLFIYTKPENYPMFKELGFYRVAEVYPHVLLLENTSRGIKSYADQLSKERKEGKSIAAIVVNCNPFTLGHQYLIEKASRENEILHLFVVGEDRSSFPAEARYELVKAGTEHLSNVIVHQGKDYIISSATFPSYFIKEQQQATKIHALLDLEIFGEYIAPALGINRRYVGDEPYCPVTNTYNDVMEKILPKKGVEVRVIGRLTKADEAISASRVRLLIRQGKINEIKELVPATTYNFILSPRGQEIIDKIKNQNSRH